MNKERNYANRNLYQEIGREKIADIIARFYDLAFEDVMIGHFFFRKDKGELVRQQINFTSRMLGSTEHIYTGKSLRDAHEGMRIGMAHFRRRHILMEQVMGEFHLSDELAQGWLERERVLTSLIVIRKEGS